MSLATAPLAARLLVGIAGTLLLFAGGRVYRLAIVAPGVIAGLYGGVLLAHALALGTGATLGIAAVLALVGGVVCHLVEKVAVVIAGVIAGAAVGHAASPAVWAPLAGAAGGAVLFPPLYRHAVALVTALAGAAAVVEAAGFRAGLAPILGLAAVGALVQFAWGRSLEDR